MSKRKRHNAVVTLEAPDELKDQAVRTTLCEVSQGQTVVNRLKVRRDAAQPLLDVIERVVHITSMTMTLVSKLGSLVQLKSQIGPSPFFLERTFWRWCMQAVTKLDSKFTFNKRVKLPAEQNKFEPKAVAPPIQMDSETAEAYAVRRQEEALAHEERERGRKLDHKTSNDKLLAHQRHFRDLIVDTWREMNAAGFNVPIGDRANLSDTLESQLAVYITNIEVSVATTLSKRIKTTLKHQIMPLVQHVLSAKARKNLLTALVDWTFNKIQGKPPPEWKTFRLNLCATFLTDETWTAANELACRHRSFIPEFAFTLEDCLSDSKYLQDNAALFLDYLGYLSDNSKKPFAVLPQLKPQARHIKIDRRSLREILIWAGKHKDQAQKSYKPETFVTDRSMLLDCKGKNTRWSANKAQMIMLDLFNMPNVGKLLRNKLTFEGTFTTDGVKACWFFTRRVKKPKYIKTKTSNKNSEKPSKKRQKKVSTRSKKIGNEQIRNEQDAAASGNMTAMELDLGEEKDEVKQIILPIQPASTLKPGIYHHGLDFWLEPDDPTKQYVFVDPGHVNIMSGVFQQANKVFNPTAAKKFSLTNRWYRAHTGMKKRKLANEKRIEGDQDMKNAVLDLAVHSCKTWDPGIYLQHVHAVFRNWSTLFRHAFHLRERYDRLATYQAKQRVVDKIVTLLASGHQNGDPKQTVLVVGSGVAKATSRGHDSAPGKELRSRISKKMAVIMTPEHYTSKMSCCCQALVVHGHYDLKTAKKSEFARIRGLSHCTKCRVTLNRDYSSAVNIRTVFWYQATTRTRCNPLKQAAEQVAAATKDASNEEEVVVPVSISRRSKEELHTRTLN